MSYDKKDFIEASITKSAMMEDAGLKLAEYNGEFIIYEVGGVFQMFTNVKKGSRLIKLQDKDIHEYSSLEEIKQVIQKEKTVSIEAVRIKDYTEILNDSSISEAEGFQLEDGMPPEN
jgi:hypothetical protein